MVPGAESNMKFKPLLLLYNYYSIFDDTTKDTNTALVKAANPSALDRLSSRQWVSA